MGEKIEKNTTHVVQNVNIEGREKVFVSGVLEVVSFDEQMVDIKTELGRLVIRGESLKLINLCPEKKEVQIGGYVYSCEYEDSVSKRKGIFKGMTR